MSFAMVILSNGPFGGAQKRFLTLFFNLKRLYKNQIFCFVTHSLMTQLKLTFPQENFESIFAIGKKNADTSKNDPKTIQNSTHQIVAKNNATNKRDSSLQYVKKTAVYKCYYFIKNVYYQKKLYKEINKFRQQYRIESFLGVHAGILPLYFYLNSKKRPGIIFTNMDSWFSNISANPQKEWHRKYVTFNYAHEKSDMVDFLSPFIYEGVKKLGINVAPEKVNITPCSFTDYSKCHIGVKSKLRIAFAGRLENDKNPVMFMNAAIILAKKYPEVEFHIMGEGRLSEVIRDKTVNSNLPNIVFHGFHPNPPEILAETSVFVSIQTTNNYPSQSVLEAMACGNAIIATDVGDTRMFVNEERGSLIELSHESLMECLKIYLAQPELALEKGLKGSKYVRENHTIEKSADYYMDLFRKAEKMAQNI